MKKLLLSLAAGACVAVTSGAQAEDATSLEEAFKQGKPYIQLRYRYEFVDQDGFSKDANASTLRTKLGYESGKFYDFKGLVEFEDITHIGGSDFNDTLNGKAATHPTVADPEDTALNQLYLQYHGIPDTVLQAGRAVVNLGNLRFVGSVGWRQNDQTLDSVIVTNKSISNTTLTYGYVGNINRIFGDDSSVGDFDTRTHVVNATVTPMENLSVTGYTYLIDIDRAATVSTATYGVNAKGSLAINEDASFGYYLEYARQSDHADNPVDFDANYYHINPSISWKGLSVGAGYEVLGSDDGTVGFSTPLATLHKFNGFADKFLATPATGLEDAYIGVGYKISGVEGSGDVFNGTSFNVVYHDFSSEEGSTDFGTEWDAVVKQKFADHYSILLKYANYDADTFSTDTQKFMIQLGAGF